MTDPLAKYRSMRDFARTPEPRGGPASPPAYPRFVIQKHDARRLHYDLRLEVDGVMPSWAVPKGPSVDPSDRRLAMKTEDHPLDYMFFEGVIPEPEYGAGPVIIWDLGVYLNLDRVPVAVGIQTGHVKVWLKGTKIEGGWALTRTATRDGKESWILVKERDAHATSGVDVVAEQPASAITGRTLDQLLSAPPSTRPPEPTRP